MNVNLVRERWELKGHFCKSCADPTINLSAPRILDIDEARQLAADLLEIADSLTRIQSKNP